MDGIESEVISSFDLEFELLLLEQEIIPKVNGVNNKKQINNFLSIFLSIKNQTIQFLYNYLPTSHQNILEEPYLSFHFSFVAHNNSFDNQFSLE